ncbi:MAG: hypothetical protein AAFO07_01085 [Bacteroidota bacterium]
MKTITTKHASKWLILSTLLLLILTSSRFEQIDKSDEDISFKLSNIEVSKQLSPRLLFRLRQGERLIIKGTKGSISGDVRLMWQNMVEDDRPFDLRNENFRSPRVNSSEPQNHQLTIEYKGSGRGTSLNLSFEIDTRKYDEAGQEQLFKFNEIVVGVEGKDQRINNYIELETYLNVNDQFTFNGGGENAGLLKYELEGNTHGMGETIPITASREYKFRFFVDPKAAKGGFISNFLGRNKSLVFKELSTDYNRAAKNSGTAQGPSSPGNSFKDPPKPGLTPGPSQVQAEEEEAEAVDPTADALQTLLQELLQKDKVLDILDLDFRIMPTAEILGGKLHPTLPNIKCKKFAVQYNEAWVYWVGAGQPVVDAFIKNQDREFMSFSRMLNPSNIYSSINNSFLERAEYKGNNKIEYAIVDEYNKLRFERGEVYSAYFSNFSVSSDYGNGNLDLGDYYICACNHNKVRSIPFYFDAKQLIYIETN